MDLGLRDRTVLITGGTAGIGLAVATMMRDAGARVALTSRNRDRARAVAAQLADNCVGYEFDATAPGDAPALVRAVENDLGGIDAYIANTGGPPAGKTGALREEDWNAAHRSLLLTPLAIITALLPHMRSQRFGRIVAIGSTTAFEPADALHLSNAYRPALAGIFTSLARENASSTVTLNHVHPWNILTDRLAAAYGSHEEAARIMRQSTAGRAGLPEEVAAAVAFLCSRHAGYITGTSIVVDGGASLSTR